MYFFVIICKRMDIFVIVQKIWDYMNYEVEII